MGSLQLHCPLCCTETFPCHNSLKYHLLSVSENLICPSCGDRFDKIFDLAMHLGNKCLEPPADVNIEVNSENEDRDTDVLVKDQEEDPLSNSILARALSKDKVPDDEPETEPCEDEVYHCSTCAVNFTSVEEHIKKFHDGHEVFVEQEKEVDNVSKNTSVFIIQDDDSNDKEEEGSCDGVQEDYFDKGGFPYTRKLVKIEKFWDPKAEEEASECTEHKDPPIDDGNTVVEVYQCQMCGIEYINYEEFEKHKCKKKLVNISAKCNVCSANFVNEKYLSLHMKTHKISASENVKPPFICEICNTELPAFKSLRLHKRMHEPIKSKHVDPPVTYGLEGEEQDDSPREKFLCMICSKEYDIGYAEAHKKFHSADKDYNCEVCNRKFFSEENLKMHMRAHNDSKKFTCSYCKKKFLSKEKLEAHISAKCQMRQYECQYCGRRFSRPHEKVKHERIHTGEKPYKCEVCGKSFRVSYCLTLHMRTHSGTRPYKCEHCGKRFKAHSVYNHHLLTHSEDRKYKCPFCPKTFKTGVQLAGHKNSHIKPFTCTECNRPFASLYAVRAHMATHKRQNNLKYKCCMCGASYARSFALRDHIKEQHYDYENKDDPAQIENIGYIISTSIEAGESILGDGGDSMLTDIADTQDVHNMEICEGSIATPLEDNQDD